MTANAFTDASFSSHYEPANLWSQASGFGLTTAGESAGSSQSFASIDLASTSPFGAAGSPMNSVIGATSPRALRLSDSNMAVDSYFGVLESLSNYGMNGQRANTGFVSPMGGNSAVPTMR